LNPKLYIESLAVAIIWHGKQHATVERTVFSVSRKLTATAKATRGFEPISYRGVLVTTLLHAIVYVFLHNLLNVLVQIANKIGLPKKKKGYPAHVEIG
jgi:hypothetical protein